MPEIDLHTHTTASDGTLTPTELVKQAKEVGLKAIAVTDHDTTNGLREAMDAGKEFGVEVIPGVELSVDFPKPGFLHMLGLYLPEHPETLTSYLEWLRERRHSRNERIIAKMQEQGLDVAYEEVVALADGGSVGRPHFARILHEKGHVSSIQHGSGGWLGSGGKAYLPKDKLTPEKAVELLVQEQATVVMAHPYSLELPLPKLEEELKRLMDMGLEGMEVLYPVHTPDMTGEYRKLAEKLGLFILGGSDFHGSVKPDIHLGRGFGDLHVPYSLLEKLKAHREAKGQPLYS